MNTIIIKQWGKRLVSSRTYDHDEVSHLLGVALLACLLAAEPPAKDEKPKTVVYDVDNLLYKHGVQSGLDKIDDLVNIIVKTVEPTKWNEPATR